MFNVMRRQLGSGKKGGLQWIILLSALVSFGSISFGQSERTDFSNCIKCHEGIKHLDTDHAFACERCHLLPGNRRQRLQTHDVVVRHPAALSNAPTFCAPCHENEINTFKNSLHYTLAGIINQTRYLWGAQEDAYPRYSASSHETLNALPPSPSSVQSPADLVDDLLRRKCLACHTEKAPIQRSGFFRGIGCAACHILYENDGIYRGNDRAMQGKQGYPQYHRFCTPIPVRQCQHCHNGHRVGADYTGLYEHDYHQSYRTPISNGTMPRRTYLMDHHRLRPDVHLERGLLCVDCHRQKDVMGKGDLVGHQQEAVNVRCKHCHASVKSDKKKVSSPVIKNDLFCSRQQQSYVLPTYDQSVTAHAIPQMANVHCVGCHSAWAFADYGPSMLRDDREDLSQWAPWRLQGDAGVADRFDEQGRFLNLSSGLGPWFVGWRFRRWEFLTLGIDVKGRVVPFRPRYQYQVSYVTRHGRVVLDNIVPQRGDQSGPGWAFMPFYPHTIVKRGRPCEACHGQSLAAGRGLWEGKRPDLYLTLPSPPVYSPLMLLSEKQRIKIMKKTPAFRQWRFKSLLHDNHGIRVPVDDH